MIVAARPTNRLMRAPQMKSVHTLRPSSSVPKMKSRLGPASSGFFTVLVTSRPLLDASHGAANASPMKTIRITSPTMPWKLDR